MYNLYDVIGRLCLEIYTMTFFPIQNFAFVDRTITIIRLVSYNNLIYDNSRLFGLNL